MARVVIAEPADADRARITESLAGAAGFSVAARYDLDFDLVYRRLELFPEIGARRTNLGKEARICVVHPYIIIYDYQKAEDIVTVLRILHGRRKITGPLLPKRP